MEYLKFTDFRNHSKKYFDKIVDGNSYVIIRKGQPIAKTLPFKEVTPGWKREIKRVTLKKSIDTLDYILK